MTDYNHAIAKLTMPARIAKLPVDERGYPVPKFVTWIDGKPDFRVADISHLGACYRKKLCWICGEPLGRFMAFVIGPMCAINRISSEPPSHLECALFAVQACPFMVHPQRGRNERDLPDGKFEAGGIPIYRNPGVSLIWVTKAYSRVAAQGGNAGVLFQIGKPTSLLWYARGRQATRAEIVDSINSGLPALLEVAVQQGPDAVAALEKEIVRGLALVPT